MAGSREGRHRVIKGYFLSVGFEVDDGKRTPHREVVVNQIAKLSREEIKELGNHREIQEGNVRLRRRARTHDEKIDELPFDSIHARRRAVNGCRYVPHFSTSSTRL